MSEPIEPTDEREGQALVELFCREFGVTEPAALETLAWCDEHGATRREIKGLDAARDLKELVAVALTLLVAVQARVIDYKIMRAITKVMCLELGFPMAAGSDNIARIARECGVSKQVLDEFSKSIQARLQMPPRIKQRK